METLNRELNSLGFFIDSFMYVAASSWWLEGKTKTPAGTAEVVRPRRSVRDEEAHRPPAESEVLHGNQQRC